MFNRYYAVHKAATKIIVTLVIVVHLFATNIHAFTTIAKNDPFPLYTSLDPHDFVSRRQRLEIDNAPWFCLKHDHAIISLSPFTQTANTGKTIYAEKIINTTVTPPVDQFTQLGDLTGRTSLIAALYGSAPTGTTLAQVSPTLAEAQTQVFAGIPADDIGEAKFIDPAQQFGFLSFPLKYRKRGLAAQAQVHVGYGFGFTAATRICSIRQTPTYNHDNQKAPVDVTPTTEDTFPAYVEADEMPIQRSAVEAYLVEDFPNILSELHLSYDQQEQVSIEEVRFSLFWRQLCHLNDEDDVWPELLLIPFVEVMGSISPSKEVSTNQLFGVPFGNNRHPATGIRGGINFDFLETVEIGAEIGFTYFFERHVMNMPIPNNRFQNNLYPFRTNVSIKPGTNCYLAGKISAYHFLDNLSMYFQYVMLEHKKDQIELLTRNDAFMPEVLARKTTFKTKLANIGFNYDISPNIALGFIWQAPLEQRNCYKSSTLLFSFDVTL